MPGKPDQLFCKGCKKWKDKDQFYKRSGVKRAYQTNCLTCAKEAKKPKPKLTGITFKDISIEAGCIINEHALTDARIVDAKALDNGNYNIVVKGGRKGKVVTVSIKGLCI